MDEFAALVEKGDVELVAFDDEEFAVSETRALVKVVGDATDDVARVSAIVFEYPGEDGGGGGFSVSAGHDQGAFAVDEKLLEKFGKGTVAELFLEDSFGFWIAARDGIADNDEVGSAGEVLFIVAGNDRDVL